MQPHVTLDKRLADRVRASVLWMTDAVIAESGAAFAELEAIAADFHRRFRGATPAEVPGVADARRLYRDFGVDPTRTRPSSEALLRRSLKQLPLYAVNDVVDWGNAVSLRHLLPLGLYDAARLQGDAATVRVGGEGEGYAGIRKGPVHLASRLCLADAAGPFGSPTSDSLRTSITGETSDLLVVVFAPPQCEVTRLEVATQMLAEGFARHAGAREVGRTRLGP